MSFDEEQGVASIDASLGQESILFDVHLPI